MRFTAKRASSRTSQVLRKATHKQIENLESRVLMSTSVSGYSTLVTNIQSGGVFPGTEAIVNGSTTNATSGPFQYQSYAIVEFDPSNTTVFPGATITTPTNLSFSLINNPSKYNSTNTAATGNAAQGSFDVYLLPSYIIPLANNLVYQTTHTAGYPLGLENQASFGATPSNYLVGTIAASATAGLQTVNLSLPTGGGTSNAATALTSFLSTNGKFELAIVPHTTTSAGEFEGEYTAYRDTNAAARNNGLAIDSALNESPQLSYTASTAGETFSTPYAAVSVNHNNIGNVAEITVMRSGYAGDAATVAYSTANGTATAGTDYTATSGTLSFAAGQTVATISVPTIDAAAAADRTFTVTLASPLSSTGVTASLATAKTATVTIVGTTNAADVIGGATPANTPSFDDTSATTNNAFTVAFNGSQAIQGGITTGSSAAISGSVSNGTGDFSQQAFDILQFNTHAIDQSQNVTALNSITLEIDNRSSTYGQFSDGTPFPSTNPTNAGGNFNVYLINSSLSGYPTRNFEFEGQDANSGGIGNQSSQILLGTASFSNQDTSRSPVVGDTAQHEGVQDLYTLNLSAAAKTALINDLNGNGSAATPGQVRLAITPGSAGFAADFANSNSQQGGQYGIQPYIWFSGTANPATKPAEQIAINYANVSVNNNEPSVSVDITRPATGYIGDTATVTFSLANGTAHLGTDYTAPSSYTVTIPPDQTAGTAIIPLKSTGATSERNFTMTLTSASATNDTTSISTTPTTITLTPVITASTTATADNNGAAEAGATSLFTGYAYVNGSASNGTGSFAFDGYQVIEFQPSQFVGAGQQVNSLTNLSLGLTNYENQSGANYTGLPGNMTVYLAGTNESTYESSMPSHFNASQAAGGDPAIYDTTKSDGVGGFTGTGPLAPTTVGNGTTDVSIPLGVVSFNTKLGLDYFTPSQTYLNKTYTLTDPNAPGGSATVTESPLTFLKNQINAGQNVRLLLAPGNPAFRAYFFGVTGGAGSGGPGAPMVAITDSVSTVKTSEQVNFGSTAYNVADNGGSITIPVTRSVVNDSGTGLNDTLTVAYATADGNALAGTNYTARTGVLTFGPGVTTQNITVPITNVANFVSGDKSFSVTLTSPTTSDSTHYVTPVIGNTGTTNVFITTNANNGQTLTQYNSSVGDIGTNGPVTFGGSALNPAPPFNFSIFSGGKYSALDFNDSSVSNFNIPSEFNGPTGPLQPTGPVDANGNKTYVSPNSSEPNGTGPVVYTPAADASGGGVYNSTVSAINEITLSFYNYFNSTVGNSLNVYLVGDATSNILPGAQGTSKNPHYYDTSTTADSNGYIGAPDGVGNQFGSATVLGTINYPTTSAGIKFNGYTTVPLTSFNAAAESTLISDLNSGTKFRLVVAPEQTSTASNADWIYGYVNANAGYAAATGVPINYYVNPELSFNVSYAANANKAALPSYISPSADANYVWDSVNHNLTLTSGNLTFFADGTADAINLVATGPTSTVTFASSSHLSGLTLSNGATANVLSLGAARSHSNHSLLVIGTLNSANDPTFSIDSTSKLDLQDNDLIVHTGTSDTSETNFSGPLGVQALVGTGRDDGAWDGLGLTSTAAQNQDNADGQESVQLAPVLNLDLPDTLASYSVGTKTEALGANDIIVKYTYTGDFNIDGQVSRPDASIFSNDYDNGRSSGNEWALGDTNSDGKINRVDASIFSNDYGHGTGSGSVDAAQL